MPTSCLPGDDLEYTVFTALRALRAAAVRDLYRCVGVPAGDVDTSPEKAINRPRDMQVLTRRPRPRRWRTAALLLVASCMLGAFGTPAIAADTTSPDVVTVHAQSVARRLSAYGQIEPMTLVRVHAVIAGTLSGLRVLPGSAVTAGEVLARIGGPRMRTFLTARQQALRSAQAREVGARQALEIARHQLATQLATRQALDVANSELVVARAAVQTAAAQLREAKALQTVRAPATGTVIAVQAANGEQTVAGQRLLTLQPAGRLWIRAAYYGADAALLHVGMTARFQPSGDDRAIPVRVAAISSGLAADAGLRVGLVPASPVSAAWWMNGQWGTVTLEGPTRSMVVVPTTALILDRGRWWVLVHTSRGDAPRQVVPGPVRGWNTWIASGLHTGEQVVVRDAFLEYHRGIAQSYQPPD
ncbi:MAG: efflux RND transporter periplasmic adaptor subunit [Thiomonas sp.]